MRQVIAVRSILIFILILIFLSLFTPYSTAGSSSYEEEGEVTKTINDSGYCSNPGSDQSNSAMEKSYTLEEGTITYISFVLTWTDDEGSSSDPDTFALAVDDGDANLKSSQGSNGEVTVTPDGEMLGTDWNVEVKCIEAGSTPVGPFGRLVEIDPGNSWTLEIIYTVIPGDETTASIGGPPPHIQAVLDHPIFKIHIFLMISSTLLFLLTGILAGVYLFTRTQWARSKIPSLRALGTVKPFLILSILVFIMFFIASVPIGMWVAGNYYGWANAWSGMPAFWNPDAYLMTNADNVSLITLILWAIPLYLNRRTIMASPIFRKLFRWSRWLMERAERAPAPILTERELGFMYFIMGIFVFTVFAVQPHG